MYFDTEREEMSDGTREDTTGSVQIEEIKRAIMEQLLVTNLSPVRAHNRHGDGWGVSQRCSACEEYDRCGKKQESPVQISTRHPTELACLQDLLQRLKDRHVDCTEALTKKNCRCSCECKYTNCAGGDDAVPAGQKTRTNRAR